MFCISIAQNSLRFRNNMNGHWQQCKLQNKTFACSPMLNAFFHFNLIVCIWKTRSTKMKINHKFNSICCVFILIKLTKCRIDAFSFSEKTIWVVCFIMVSFRLFFVPFYYLLVCRKKTFRVFCVVVFFSII